MMTAQWLIVARLITVTMTLMAMMFTVHTIVILYWTIVVVTGLTVTL